VTFAEWNNRSAAFDYFSLTKSDASAASAVIWVKMGGTQDADKKI
jgi:hypothetical protein